MFFSKIINNRPWWFAPPRLPPLASASNFGNRSASFENFVEQNQGPLSTRDFIGETNYCCVNRIDMYTLSNTV